MSDEGDVIAPAVHKWIGVIGLVVAPTTLVTGLCYYFGYISTRKMLAYLGIDSDAVGFSTKDYVTKSTGVLFVTALATLLACTAVLGLCAYLHRLADARRHLRQLRAAAWTLIVLGAAAMVRGVLGVVRPEWVPDKQLWLTPVALGTGAALFMLGGWILRIVVPQVGRLPLVSLERALLTVAVAVLILALFWTTNIFATKVGEVDGINAAGKLWSTETTVILDTPDRLFLPKELVRTSQLTDATSAQGETFRYECFRAFAVRGDLWVLVPANWRPQFGYAVLVTADAAHRITLRSIKDAPDRIGGGANVREFWPCPELVSTATGAVVPAQLLPAADVSRILGGAAVSVTDEYKQLPADAGTQNCAGAVDSASQAISGDTGYRVRYARHLLGHAGTPPLNIEQSVAEFDTPHSAADFIEATTAVWQQCANTDVALNRDGSTQRYRIGAVSASDHGVVIATVSSTVNACSHALAAKSNVAVDVTVCGSTAGADAANLLNAIRDRFPT